MNKDIDLCGLGNALVDFQFEVSDSELKEFGVNKGEMTLVDAEAQKVLLDKLIDRKQNKCSGGSAANSIIAFTKFGGKAAYITILGKDELAKFYADEFKSIGIELHAEEHNQPNGTCVVMITPDAERTMATCLGASALMNKSNISEDIIKRSKWLYVEGYELTQDDSAEACFYAIELAKKNDTKIAVTVSDVFICQVFYDNLKKAVDNADLIFCNEAEARAYTKTDSVEEAIKAIAGICPNYAVTKGNKGSTIKFNDVQLEIPAYSTKAIDTTGAGDMFAGAFMYGVIKADSTARAGHLGSFASSKIVAQQGARLSEDHIELRNTIFNKIDK